MQIDFNKNPDGLVPAIIQDANTKNGFANQALAALSDLVNIPVIASGGAGTISHFSDTFKDGKADAALAASVFHFKEIEINTLKEELKEEGIPVRI